jgi:hypothetical protein
VTSHRSTYGVDRHPENRISGFVFSSQSRWHGAARPGTNVRIGISKANISVFCRKLRPSDAPVAAKHRRRCGPRDVSVPGGIACIDGAGARGGTDAGTQGTKAETGTMRGNALGGIHSAAQLVAFSQTEISPRLQVVPTRSWVTWLFQPASSCRVSVCRRLL